MSKPARQEGAPAIGVKATIEIFLVQEGARPNPSGKPWFETAASQIGRLGKLTRIGGLDEVPKFGTATTFDGVRQARYLVVKIEGRAASEAARQEEGLYRSDLSIDAARALKNTPVSDPTDEAPGD